jgi:hypothetical protein
MKHHHLLIFLIVTALNFNCVIVSHAQENTARMKIFSEVPGADAILAGKYRVAISQMQAAKRINTMALFNNLCVAYTLSHQFDEARYHCNRAIKETFRHSNYSDTRQEQIGAPRIKRRYRALAREHFQIFESLERSRKND